MDILDMFILILFSPHLLGIIWQTIYQCIGTLIR